MATKEVRFDKWCRSCKYRFRNETEDPCNNCLDNPSNEDSTKPVEYKKSTQKGEVKNGKRRNTDPR